MLVTPPCGASSNIALWRAKIKPPVELVVGDLDGFDEVKNEISNQVTSQIFNLSEKYPDNHYILSSRPLDEFVGWNQFEELYSNPLSKEQALSLIKKIEYDQNIKEKFYKELRKIGSIPKFV